MNGYYSMSLQLLVCPLKAPKKQIMAIASHPIPSDISLQEVLKETTHCAGAAVVVCLVVCL